MAFNYLSVCSGIEAATQAWHPLGWRPWAFSQFDPDHKGKGLDFASAVLKFHYPDVPNLGDMTKYREWPDATLDALVGGTPCQSFSVAGLRGGLDDERGNLMLVYCAIARKYRPRWVVWENVPGVLSDDGGRSFASLLGLLSGSRVEVPPGGWQSAGVVDGYSGAYGLSWRVLDAQYVRVDGFGRAVPQRRRRVFVVGHIGGAWQRAAAVLFEREGLSGNSPPRRGSREGVAGSVVASADRRGGVGDGERGGLIPEVTHSLRADGFDAGEDGTGRGTPLVPEVANPLTARMFKGVNTTMDEGQTMVGEPIPFDETQITNPNNRSSAVAGAPPHALAAGARPPAIAFSAKDYGNDAREEVSPTLRAGGFKGSHQNGGVMPAVAFSARQGPDVYDDRTGPLDTDGGTQAVLAWQNRFRGDDGRGYVRAPTAMEDVAGTLDTVKPWHVAQGPAYSLRSDAPREGVAKTPSPDAEGRARLRDPGFNFYEEVAPTSDAGAAHIVSSGWMVRRLTPTECEKLQGFPPGFTNIPWRGKNGAPDGPRYKALGNSMACNVMRWIGRRIQMVDDIFKNNIDIGSGKRRMTT